MSLSHQNCRLSLLQGYTCPRDYHFSSLNVLTGFQICLPRGKSALLTSARCCVCGWASGLCTTFPSLVPPVGVPKVTEQGDQARYCLCQPQSAWGHSLVASLFLALLPHVCHSVSRRAIQGDPPGRYLL